MKQHKHHGFTIIELVIVIIVIVILATISAVAYRTTQAKARDEKRKADVILLKGALEEYHSDFGGYPMPGTCSSGSGSTNECYAGEVWTILKNAGYIDKIPVPDLVHPTPSDNFAPGSKSHYIYLGTSPTAYAIYVLTESGTCKTGKNVVPSWWGAHIPMCSF